MNTSRHHPASAGRAPRRDSGVRGVAMVEVMIALVLCAFGLLGFAALQSRAAGLEFESYQRSQALVLLGDIVSRINASRANAGDYVVDGLVGGGDVENCAGKAGSALDLCEWANLLRGASETRNGHLIGSMQSARGCIVRAADASDRYIVSVAWVGSQATQGPGSTCGLGAAGFSTESLRRAVSATICVGRLRDPAVAPAVSRC